MILTSDMSDDKSIYRLTIRKKRLRNISWIPVRKIDFLLVFSSEKDLYSEYLKHPTFFIFMPRWIEKHFYIAQFSSNQALNAILWFTIFKSSFYFLVSEVVGFGAKREGLSFIIKNWKRKKFSACLIFVEIFFRFNM